MEIKILIYLEGRSSLQPPKIGDFIRSPKFGLHVWKAKELTVEEFHRVFPMVSKAYHNRFATAPLVKIIVSEDAKKTRKSRKSRKPKANATPEQLPLEDNSNAAIGPQNPVEPNVEPPPTPAGPIDPEVDPLDNPNAEAQAPAKKKRARRKRDATS